MQKPWTEVLADKWWIATVALLASLVATPLLRLLMGAPKTAPRDRRGAAKPVSTGGPAIWVGLLAGLACCLPLIPDLADRAADVSAALARLDHRGLATNPLWTLISIALAVTAMTGIGLLSEQKRLRRRWQLLLQVLVGAILLSGGVGARIGGIVLAAAHVAHIHWLVMVVDLVACGALVIVMSNASKVLADLDGLCSGITGIIALSFLVLTTWLAAWHRWPVIDELRVGLSLSLAGAVIGFLPYDVAPARAFLGRSGGMLLGGVVAIVMAMFCQEGNIRWMLGALMVLSIPLADTAITVLRRLRSGVGIFRADRSHLHHQLLDRGVSMPRVVGLYYALSALAGVLGVVVALSLRLRAAVPVYVVFLVALVAVLAAMGFTRPERRGRRQAASEHSGALRLLFTCVGRRVSLLQEFRRVGAELDVELVIHGADRTELAPAMEVADERLVPPALDDPQYVPTLVEYCRAHEIKAVIPLIDPELPLLAGAKAAFEAVGTRVIVSSPEVIRICSDKALTGEFLLAHGFDTPHVLTEAELASPTFPLFVKPRKGSASFEAHKIPDAAGLAYYRQRVADCVVQEFVDGAEYTIDVFADFRGKARCAVPRRRIAVMGGEVSKARTFKDRRLMAESCRLVEALGGCEGMITVQCFVTAAGRIVFTEVNPRFGGGVPLSVEAGADAPRWLIELLMGRDCSATMDGWADGVLMLRYDHAVYVRPH